MFNGANFNENEMKAGVLEGNAEESPGSANELSHEGVSISSREIVGSMETTVLEPQLYEVNGKEVVVTGNPYELGEVLDDCQGDNIYNFGGDCGLVSVANILTMSGIEITEDEIVGKAISMGECNYSEYNSPEANGGTNVYNRAALLESYGINCTIFDPTSAEGSIESLAEYVENCHGVNISINAGLAWNEPALVDDGTSNHSVIVTGTARDPETGELIGLYVCDSGLTETESGSVLMTVDQLEECYTNVTGASALVTNEEIR